MKKIISMLLVIILICTFCVPVFAAENEPKEYMPSGAITILKGDDCIISKGDYSVRVASVYAGSTLTIGKDAKITVNRSLENLGTINVLGTLDVTNCSDSFNIGTIHVSCSGTIKGNIGNINGRIVYDKHIWKDGICTVCGVKGCEVGELEHVWEKGICTVCGVIGCEVGELDHVWEKDVCTICGVTGCEVGEFEHNWVDGVCTICGSKCTNEFHNGIHVCPDCGMSFDPTQGNTLTSGSAISEGNLTIVVGVAAAVIFGLAGFLLGRKKKYMPSNSKAGEDE